MKRILFFILPFLVFTFPSSAKTVDRILAKVGDDVITTSDQSELITLKKNLYRFNYDKQESAKKIREMQKDPLKELIFESLLKQEIAKSGIQVTDQELESEYQFRLQGSQKPEKFFVEELGKYGLSLRDYKENLKFQLSKQRFIQKNIYPKIDIPDRALQTAYNSRKSDFQQYNSFRFVEVVLHRESFSSDQEMDRIAETIHNQLQRGSSQSAAMIKKYSMGGFKESGGDSGFIASKDLNPQIRMLLEDLKPGETSQVFKREKTAFIFKLIKRSDPQPLPFSEVASQLKMELMQTEVEKELENYLMAAKDQTYVEILK